MGLGSTLKKAAGGAMGLVGSLLGGGGVGDFGAGAKLEEVLKEIEKLPITDLEKEQLLLELPTLMEEMQVDELGASAMQEISLDPRIREAQMSALEELSTRGEQGLTLEDKIMLDQVMQRAGAEEQSRQQSILQGAAQRGNLDSGMQLAAQLASSQGSAQREAEAAQNQALAAMRGKQDALERAANVAGQIGSQEFAQQAQKASAEDIINQFNLQNRQRANERNIQERQRLSEQQSALKNQQQMYNKGLLAQQRQDQYQKAQMKTGALTNQANLAQQQSAAEAQRKSNQMAGLMQLGGTIGSAALMSDKNMKENIQSMNPDQMRKHLQDMLDQLDSYKYNYKQDPEKEEYVGIMAQDLEKSKLGSQFVEEDENGNKMVDYGKMAGTQLAATSDLHDRVSALEELMGLLSKNRRQ